MAQTAHGGLGSTGKIAVTQVGAEISDPFGLSLSKPKAVPISHLKTLIPVKKPVLLSLPLA
jgi:hypothetical protein